MSEIVILIPAFNPDESLADLAESLKRLDFSNIIVIDDGSSPKCRYVFQKVKAMGCHIVSHEVNRGKGAALKSGIREAVRMFGKGNAYVTADADGQHLPNDICKVALQLWQRQDVLVLGTRSFEGSDVPWKSRWGNRITSFFFRITNGIYCPDTQTGLRGIPACLEELAEKEEGDRYDYEMNFLTDAVKQADICFVPIKTVYKDQNRTSHFRPFADSLLVYGRFLRFLGSSLMGAGVDFLVFYLLCSLPLMLQTERVIIATVLARICSGMVNYLLNRFWSFRSQMSAGREAVRYGILFFCQMAVSAGFTAVLTLFLLPALLAKLVTDICLFFISYVIQKNWVFRKEAVE